MAGKTTLKGFFKDVFQKTSKDEQIRRIKEELEKAGERVKMWAAVELLSAGVIQF
jgi:hypothetical protein